MMSYHLMRITTASFLKSAASLTDLPHDTKAHVIFLGRSNVGKSSLLNALTNQKGLAHVSKTPGRTQLINLFDINDAFYFVDLPGYGYAKIPKTMQAEIAERISNYVHECDRIKLAVLICDAKIGPTKNDLETRNLITDGNIPYIVIANKWDALTMSEKIQSSKRFSEAFPEKDIVTHSVVDSIGREKILALIEQALNK